jgi:hypothetical protein
MPKFNQDELARKRFSELADMREQYKDDPQAQVELAPYEHGKFSEGLTQEDPLNALGLAVATPVYAGAKMPGIIHLSKLLGIVGQDATPADLEQVKQAYMGIGRGLKNADWTNTGGTLKSMLMRQ